MRLFSHVRLGKGAIALVVAIGGALALAGSALATGSNAGGDQNTSRSAAAQVAVAATCSGVHVWAVVNSDGSLARHGNGCAATTSSTLSTGTYQVIFPRTITHCAFTAAIGLSGFGGASAPGFITVVGRAGTTNGVFIQTYNASGVLTNMGFHLVVSC